MAILEVKVEFTGCVQVSVPDDIPHDRQYALAKESVLARIYANMNKTTSFHRSQNALHLYQEQFGLELNQALVDWNNVETPPHVIGQWEVAAVLRT
jgi:hypothetical protein